MANCPHCNESIESLSGFVKQSVLEERLNAQKSAKDGEIAALREQVTDLNGKVTASANASEQLAALKAQIEAREQQDARTAALRANGVDPGHLAKLEVFYKSATAGEAEPKAFDKWIAEDAKADPFFSGLFSGTPAAPANPAGTPPANPAGTPPANPTAGSGVNVLGSIPSTTVPAAPPASGKLTPDDIKRYSESEEYRALPRDKQREKIAELRGRIETQHRAGG